MQRDQLVQACDESLSMTDTGLEFVLCELAKLVDSRRLGKARLPP